MEPQPRASSLFHESHILSGTAEIGVQPVLGASYFT